MKDNKDNIKKIVSSLKEFEAEPPVDLWDRIETNMRRRKRLVILRYTSLAATLLIILGIGISQLDVNDSAKKSIDRTEVSISDSNANSHDSVTSGQFKADANKKHQSYTAQTSVKNEVIKTKSEKLESTLAENERDAKYQPTKLIDAGQDEKINVLEYLKSDSSNIANAIAERATISVNQKYDSMALASGIDDRTSRLDRLQDSMMQVRAAGLLIDSLALAEMINELNESQDIQVSGNQEWSLSLGYGSGGSVDLSSSKDYLDASSNYSPEKFSSSIADQTAYFREISDVEHNPPLAIAATVSYPLSPKWSLETGVVYTRLGYNLETYTQNFSNRKYSITLHYLGIPMGVRFQLFEKRRIGMYLVQSLILEKGITSRAVSDLYTNNSLITSASETEPIKGVQLSSFTGVGLEARTFNSLYVYGQGGVQAFFLNKTQPFNIRSEHIAWPSFQLGIRLKLQ